MTTTPSSGSHPASTTPRLARWRRALGGVALAVVLALAFAGYLRPEFMLDLANRFVLCF